MFHAAAGAGAKTSPPFKERPILMAKNKRQASPPQEITLPPPEITGTLEPTEDSDAASFTGLVGLLGTLAVTEAADTASFRGTRYRRSQLDRYSDELLKEIFPPDGHPPSHMTVPEKIRAFADGLKQRGISAAHDDTLKRRLGLR